MSEIYGSGGDNPDTGSSADRSRWPAGETGMETCAEDGEPLTRGEYADQMRGGAAAEDREYEGYSEDPDTEKYADIDAILAGPDGLPDRQKSWDYTWGEKAGERPQWADEDDATMAEYDKQAEAFLAAQEKGLPTRAESRAATWADHPVYQDETDLVAADDEDADAATPPQSLHGADHDGTGQAREWTLTEASDAHDTVAEDSTPRGDHPYADITGRHADHDHDDSAGRATAEADQQRTGSVSETDAGLRQQVADLKAENAQLGRGIAEWETENAQLGKSVADLKSENAQLRSQFDSVTARLERLEQNGAGKPLALDTSRVLSHTENADEKAQQTVGRREWTSNEAIGFAAMAGGGIVTTAADYWRYLPGTYAGITASVLGVGAAAVALIRKHKEVRDAAHRPED